MARTNGKGADFVIEAAGYDDARASAVESLTVNGTLGLFGLPERLGLAPFPVNTLFRRKVTVRAAHSTQREPGLVSFREAVSRLQKKTLDVDFMLTHVYPIERVGEAIAHAAEPHDRSCKIGISFDED